MKRLPIVALVGVLASLWASVAAAAPAPVGGLGAVTVTVTPTILVGTDSSGNPVTVGTVIPTQTVSSGSGSLSPLLWSLIAVLAVLVAGILGWWLAGRKARSGPDGARAGSTEGATSLAAADEVGQGDVGTDPPQEQNGRHQR